MVSHKRTDFVLGLGPNPSTSTELADEVTITKGFVAEPRRREVM